MKTSEILLFLLELWRGIINATLADLGQLAYQVLRADREVVIV